MLVVYSRDPAVIRLFTEFQNAVLTPPRSDLAGSFLWDFNAASLDGVSELVPSFADPGSPDLVARFSVTAVSRGGETSRIDFDSIGGPFPSPPHRKGGGGVSLDVDTLKITTPLEGLHVRVEFAHGRVPSSEAIVALSFRTTGGTSGSGVVLSEGELFVPPLSQFAQSERVGHRICSPTSVAMVLRSYGINALPLEVAEQAYVPQHDLYGVWPANIAAAATWGIAGALCHLSTWESVDYFLRRGIPLVASIRYTAQNLHGAAFYRPGGETTAHLVVVRGARSGRVIVNDPAGRTEEEVRREYDATEFARVWFGGSGMAYLLLPPRSREAIL